MAPETNGTALGTIRMTQMAACAGCAAKMGPLALAEVLRPLAMLFPPADHPNILVGLDRADDAAVYRLSDTRAIVATTDFFPPVVDDPYDFGAIAAANAMSDVFAMGGEVLMALNLVAFPDDLDPAVAAAILRGGAEKVREAGGAIAGGHSVVDREPKYGLAVIGEVHPDAILRKGRARPGDQLVLTKPLGTGLVTTALKQGVASSTALEAATRSMSALNRSAGRLASRLGGQSATDVTGFGLIGHASEMALAAGVAFRFETAALPLLPEALAYAKAGCIPGGTGRNREAFAGKVTGLAAFDAVWQALLFDPQTSGGLLVAFAPDRAEAFVSGLAAEGLPAWIVGSVVEGAGIVLA